MKQNLKYEIHTTEGLFKTDEIIDIIQQKIWHREDGPVYISYSKDGSIEYEFWYLDAVPYLKEEYEKEMFKRKVALL